MKPGPTRTQTPHLRLTSGPTHAQLTPPIPPMPDLRNHGGASKALDVFRSRIFRQEPTEGEENLAALLEHLMIGHPRDRALSAPLSAEDLMALLDEVSGLKEARENGSTALAEDQQLEVYVKKAERAFGEVELAQADKLELAKANAEIAALRRDKAELSDKLALANDTIAKDRERQGRVRANPVTDDAAGAIKRPRLAACDAHESQMTPVQAFPAAPPEPPAPPATGRLATSTAACTAACTAVAVNASTAALAAAVDASPSALVASTAAPTAVATDASTTAGPAASQPSPPMRSSPPAVEVPKEALKMLRQLLYPGGLYPGGLMVKEEDPNLLSASASVQSLIQYVTKPKKGPASGQQLEVLLLLQRSGRVVGFVRSHAATDAMKPVGPSHQQLLKPADDPGSSQPVPSFVRLRDLDKLVVCISSQIRMYKCSHDRLERGLECTSKLEKAFVERLPEEIRDANAAGVAHHPEDKNLYAVAKVDGSIIIKNSLLKGEHQVLSEGHRHASAASAASATPSLVNFASSGEWLIVISHTAEGAYLYGYEVPETACAPVNLAPKRENWSQDEAGTIS